MKKEKMGLPSIKEFLYTGFQVVPHTKVLYTTGALSSLNYSTFTDHKK